MDSGQTPFLAPPGLHVRDGDAVLLADVLEDLLGLVLGVVSHAGLHGSGDPTHGSLLVVQVPDSLAGVLALESPDREGGDARAFRHVDAPGAAFLGALGDEPAPVRLHDAEVEVHGDGRVLERSPAGLHVGELQPHGQIERLDHR